MQLAARQLDQVLLQRCHAEGVFHLEVAGLTVRPFGADPVLAVTLKEADIHAIAVEARLLEITKHRCRVRFLHRQIVLRTMPGFVLRGMALGAFFGADKVCGGQHSRARRTCGDRRWRSICLVRHGQQIKQQAAQYQQRKCGSQPDADTITIVESGTVRTCAGRG